MAIFDTVDQRNVYPTTTGTSTAYVLNTYDGTSTLYPGYQCWFDAHTDCGTGVTIDVNGSGAEDLRIHTTGTGNRSLYDGEITSRGYYHIVYDGTRWLLQNRNSESDKITWAPTWGSSSGTISLVSNVTRTYQWVSATRVQVNIYNELLLTGTTAAYLTSTLPFTANSFERYGARPVWGNGISGNTNYLCLGYLSSGTTLIIGRSDIGSIPINDNFYIGYNFEYMAAV